MRIACIIPTLDRPVPLARTLRSLEVQTAKPDEVVVVRQSDQSMPEGVYDLPITWVRQDAPNAERARNDGFMRTTTDLVLFLDDDIEADRSLLEVYLELFKDSDLGAVCGMILEPGQEATMEMPAEVGRRPMGWSRFPLNYGGDRETRNFSSCNTCVRRDLHVEAGGFDENFVATILDDSDWSIRLCEVMERRGMEGRHVGSARVTHFREPRGGRRIGRPSRHVKVDAEGWASRLYFWRKNYGFAAVGELARFARMDLLAGSLLARPTELVRAWSEFVSGWSLASRRLEAGPCDLQHPRKSP